MMTTEVPTTTQSSVVSKKQTVFEQSALEAFETHFRNLKGSEAIRRNKQQAFDRFSQLGFPTKKQEAYKYVNLALLQNMAFEAQPSLELSPDALTEIQAKIAQFPQAPNRVVLVNGLFHAGLSKLPLTGNPFSPSWIQHSSLETLDSCETSVAISQLIGNEKITQTTSPFLALNIALTKQSLMIHVPANQQTQEILQIIYVSHNADKHAKLTNPLVLLKLGANSRLQLNSYVLSTDNSQPSLENLLLIADLEANAQLENDWLNAPNQNTSCILNQVVLSKQQTQYRQTSLTLSGQTMRQSTRVEFLEGGAHASLNGISLLSGQTQSHDHLHVMHNIPNCTSSQIFKGILKDETIYDFDGTIVIPKHAVQTFAEQLNKNLLLSDKARVYTRPQLKIDADDVKCSHGATVGQLSDKELFYLQSRGIPKEVAKSILTIGFAQAVLESVESPELKAFYSQKIIEKLSS